MRALLVVLAHQMVHEERLAATRRTQYELVPVRGDAPLHRQVTDVEVQRFAREPVHHLDAEGRERTAVVGFLREEAHRLFGEGVERLLRRKVRRVAGHRRPVERGAVDGVVAWHALHACQLTAHIVLDVAQLLRIVAPCHDVEMRSHRGQPVGMCLVQVLLYPLTVDAVAPTVSGERLHVAGGLLELLQVLLTVVQNHILVVDVVAGQQQPYGACEGETAVRTVGGEFLVPDIGGNFSGQVFRIGEGMQAQAVVADAHLPCREVDVLQCPVSFGHERKVTLYESGLVLRTDDLIGGEAAQPDEAAVVHDAGELFRSLHEFLRRFPVQFLWDDMPTAQRAEVALHTVALLRGLRQEEVTGVLQVGTLVEVTLKRAAQKTHVIFVQLWLVLLLDEPVLLVDDGIVGQHLDGLAPAAVYGLVFRTRHGVEFRQLHLVGYREVGILRDDAAVLYRHQGKLVFQCCHF